MPTLRAYDGTELAYRVMGEGEPLICLPGGSTRAAACLGDLGGLSRTRQLVLLDLRGTGDSANSADRSTYHCGRSVDDVETLRVHLGLRQVDLLAHSTSGDLAVLYAARHPRRLRSLILVAPGTRAVGLPATGHDVRDAPSPRDPEPGYPVLLLAGECDSAPSPDRAARLAALFPDAEFAVQRGAGHCPWIDDPGAFARTLTAFLDPEVSSVRPGGIRLAYRTWGDPCAPPVVLAHGRCGDSRDWAAVARELAAHHRVYALDFRGHGLSDWPGRYSFELFRDDLHGFLEARNLAGATVVGHSMGGAAALMLAEQQPGLIGSLVIEDAPPPVPLDPPRPPAERPGGPLGFDWPVVPAIDDQLNDPDPAVLERLGDITAPTLLIGGTRSHIDQRQLVLAAERIPGGRFVPVDAGHLVHTENPGAFLAALRSFGVG
ncbi:alpha/beta fold hydrolase [Streptomyces halstedii]|uniref:alpha/beta fold hydrolase n=1 Tax=Streptomyces halstedii TaxID=1944 RepID=UPI00381732E8